MHIDFSAPNTRTNALGLVPTPTHELQHALSAALGTPVTLDSNPFTLVTACATYVFAYVNGGVRMTVRGTPALTQYEVDCVCKEIRYRALGYAWVRQFRFGYQLNHQITDDEFVELSRKTASWSRLRGGGAVHIRATCPNCGIRNLHTMPTSALHQICGPKRIRERGEIKLLWYDCPGYIIDPLAARGLFNSSSL